MRGLKYVSLCFLVLGAASAHADSWCRYSKDLSAEMDLRGVDSIEIQAVSGDLNVAGAASPDRVSASGRACVDKKYRDRLDEFRIVEERDGSLLRIIAYVPYRNDERGWRVGGLDLTLTVPDDLPLKVTDSSGDIDIGNVQSLELDDSSGDIKLSDIKGHTLIGSDSSGDIDIRDSGDVTINIDSSGDIDVRRVTSLAIGTDSSGTIEARDVERDVIIGMDSSGDVKVSDVGGDFTVEHDSSGDIRHNRVAGVVRIPKD